MKAKNLKDYIKESATNKKKICNKFFIKKAAQKIGKNLQISNLVAVAKILAKILKKAQLIFINNVIFKTVLFNFDQKPN